MQRDGISVTRADVRRPDNHFGGELHACAALPIRMKNQNPRIPLDVIQAGAEE
jgi:hypothetical protein